MYRKRVEVEHIEREWKRYIEREWEWNTQKESGRGIQKESGRGKDIKREKGDRYKTQKRIYVKKAPGRGVVHIEKTEGGVGQI